MTSVEPTKKKLLTPFFLFRKDVIKEVNKENPGLKITQVASIIGEKWRALDTETKEKYKEEHQRAKEARDQEYENAKDQDSGQEETELVPKTRRPKVSASVKAVKGKKVQGSKKTAKKLKRKGK